MEQLSKVDETRVWCFLKLCQSSSLMPPSQSSCLASPNQTSHLTPPTPSSYLTPPSQSFCVRPLDQATVICTKKSAVRFFTPSLAYMSIRTKVNQGNLWPLSNPFPHPVFPGIRKSGLSNWRIQVLSLGLILWGEVSLLRTKGKV